jgi:virulence-associated protein VagC
MRWKETVRVIHPIRDSSGYLLTTIIVEGFSEEFVAQLEQRLSGKLTSASNSSPQIFAT